MFRASIGKIFRNLGRFQAMKIRWLENFVIVAEEKSISRATHRLNTSQAALSRVIREMEAILRVELFQRTGRGMALTTEGKLLYDEAKRVIYTYQGFLTKVQDIQGDSVASLRVLLPLRTSTFLLRPFLTTFHGRYVRAKAKVFEALSEDIQKQLCSKEAEIGIYYSPHIFEKDNAEKIATEALYLAGTADVIGSYSDPISMKDVEKISLIMQSKPATFRSFVESSFEQNNCKLNIRHDVNTVNGQLHFARAGDGAVIFPYSSISHDAVNGSLIARRIVDPEIRRDVLLGTSSQALTRIQRDAMGMMKDIISAARKDLRWDIVKD